MLGSAHLVPVAFCLCSVPSDVGSSFRFCFWEACPSIVWML